MDKEIKTKRYSFQEIRKHVMKRCFFCGDRDYSVLDVHRIVPGEDGGKYTEQNTLVVCCKCHRLVHADKIVIEKKYKTSRPNSIVHFWDNGEEKWEYEEMG